MSLSVLAKASGRVKLFSVIFVLSVFFCFSAFTPASATLIPIGIGDFSGSESLIDFGLNYGAVVDGMVENGVTFGFTVGEVASNNAVLDAGAPSNNASAASIMGTETGGVLSILFPSLQNRIGYGFVIFTPSAETMVELFDISDTSLGTVSLTGVQDPYFPGGFLGVESSVPFLRAEVTWPGGSAPQNFLFDNLTYESTSSPVPEPSTFAFMALGIAGAIFCRKLGR